YSLLDGVGQIENYLERAKELGMKSMGITDHGNMFGAIEFYKAAKKVGIKPVIGMEGYISPETFDPNVKERKNFHLVLLAKNEIGYKNLVKLSSYGYIKGFYYKPCISKEFLKEHTDGIIALSACMAGEISQSILNEDKEEATDKIIEEYISMFGKENFYIEIQANGIDGQKDLNGKLINFAKRHEVEIVATNDTHYVMNGDHAIQDIFICIQTGAKINDYDRMKFESEELYLKSREQIMESFANFGDESLNDSFMHAINNTEIIAEKCNLEIEFGVFKFPKYDLPQNYNSIEEYLKTLVFEGLKKRYDFSIQIPEEIYKRADYELEVINKMGYAEYFIVVWDFISFAKNSKIPIGPGRGSAAGSLIAYALGITEVDPLEYNLIFERFLNPERVSMPDIDVDICQERRQEVINYVIQKYGSDHVAQIITFGRMKARAAVRDVGRVLDVPLSKIDKLAKLLPAFDSIEKSIKTNSEVAKIYTEDFEIQKVLDFAKRMENTVRHASIHAAGVVITGMPLTDIVPLYSDNKGLSVSTQYQMKEVEELGILKMDFLGLRNLTILQRAIDIVRETKNIEIILNKISLNDEKVYQMISHGDTSGVFQLESSGIRKLLIKVRPDKFSDIIAILALYRPGPLGSNMVDDFIDCKNNGKKIVYPHESLEEILKETYGVILYQEQVMKIATTMAKFSLGESDNLRRAMSKKDFRIMENNRKIFIDRSVENGYEEKKAEEVFNLIDSFAGYGFNKSHSAAYGLIAYWTAYFKANFMTEYYAAIMTSMGQVEDIAFYIDDAKSHKVKILPPDVNSPVHGFKVNDNMIVFSISAIKNIGDVFVEKLIFEREKNGAYKTFEEFVTRTKKIGLTKKILSSLIYSGALDSVEGNRKQKIEGMEKILIFADRAQREDDIQQMNLFGEGKNILNKFSFPNVSEYSMEEILDFEKEYLGFYLSAHPLDSYKNLIQVYSLQNISDLSDEKFSQHVKSYGIIRTLKKIVTKKESKIMVTFTLEDYISSIQVTVFPREYEKFMDKIQIGKIVMVEGNIQVDYFNGNETNKLLLKNISLLDELESDTKYKCYVLIQEDDKDKFNKLKEILEMHQGKTPLVFAINSGEEKEVRPSKYKVACSKLFISKVAELIGLEKIIIK
ncbi:MAG: DNA polymerase III subunit alpha, partial [Fusobacteriaceae bacterium]